MGSKAGAFAVIDFLILSWLVAWELLLRLINFLGFAWWAKIDTQKPDATYWFGPFLTNRTLQAKLQIFLLDLASEKPSLVTHKSIRCSRIEPFTNNL